MLKGVLIGWRQAWLQSWVNCYLLTTVYRTCFFAPRKEIVTHRVLCHFDNSTHGRISISGRIQYLRRNKLYILLLLRYEPTHQFDLFCTLPSLVGCSGRKNRKIGIIWEVLVRFLSVISNEQKKNKWGLILVLFALWRQMGVPTYFCAHQIWISYWSRSTGRSTPLVEVQKWSNWCVPHR